MAVIFPQLWTAHNHNRGNGDHYSGKMQNEATLALADNVRRIMEYKAWTLVDLARVTGVSKSALGYLVTYRDGNDRHPTTKTIEGIAASVGIPVWQLMMPGLPMELLNSQRLTKLVYNYRDAPAEGRAQVERIAESEVKYAVAESVLTGTVKTGTGGH
jgi:transcriptional regulator with XRE-family HTH domain